MAAPSSSRSARRWASSGAAQGARAVPVHRVPRAPHLQLPGPPMHRPDRGEAAEAAGDDHGLAVEAPTRRAAGRGGACRVGSPSRPYGLRLAGRPRRADVYQGTLSQFQGLEVDWRRGKVRVATPAPERRRRPGPTPRTPWRQIELSADFFRDLEWWSAMLARRNCTDLDRRLAPSPPSQVPTRATGAQASSPGSTANVPRCAAAVQPGRAGVVYQRSGAARYRSSRAVLRRAASGQRGACRGR